MFAVFLGGGLGAVLRFLTGKLFFPNTALSVLVVNITGSFILGFLLTKIDLPAYYRNFFIVGFCGGFTTFSAFSLETFIFIQNSQYLLAAIYAAANVTISLLAVIFGVILARYL